MTTISSPALQPVTVWSRLRHRLDSCWPSRAHLALGAMLWATAMAASAAFRMWGLGWETPDKIAGVVMLYAAGGLLAFPIGLFVARFVALGHSDEAAFASAFLALATSTIAIIGLIFAFCYRSYYAEWHDEPGSMVWMFQLVFTTLSALYQFAVLGVRLLFPVGLFALFAASFWFASLPR
jgi:hypothetical protein